MQEIKSVLNLSMVRLRLNNFTDFKFNEEQFIGFDRYII